jgi:predicted RNA binding protein YcfA (HicA-like mRNA interferase family)
MPNLPTLTGKDVVAAFESLGFVVARITDSHRILKKPGFKYNLSVPIHKSKTIKPGTLRTLIRKAAITIEEFCRVLK